MLNEINLNRLIRQLTSAKGLPEDEGDNRRVLAVLRYLGP
jgi:hypothetical protein